MTTIDMREPGTAQRLVAVTLKGHLKLMALGMKNSRISGRQMLDKATAITGKKYKRGQYDLAVQDLEAKFPKIVKAK